MPSVISWSLDLDVGDLILEIANNESLNVSAINCSAIQIVGRAMDANRSGIECSSNPRLSGSSLTINLSFNDRYRLSVDFEIATNVSDTFLVIDEEVGIFNDAGNLLPISLSSPLQAITVIPDTTGPVLHSFDLDLNTGILNLEFSEPVTILRPSAITLQSSPTANSTSYTLTGGALLSEPSAASLQVALTDHDLNTIKALTDLATSVGNTFLSHTHNLTTDYALNEVFPVSSTRAIQTAGIIRDTTLPLLIRFSLDMNAAELKLTYDETVDVSTIDVTAVTLQSGPGTMSTMYTLTGGNVTGAASPIVSVTLAALDVAALMADSTLATELSNTYISFPPGVVLDYNGNPVVGISPEAPLQVSSGTVNVSCSSLFVLYTFLLGMLCVAFCIISLIKLTAYG